VCHAPFCSPILLVYIFHETPKFADAAIWGPKQRNLSGTTQKVIEMSETNTCVRTWMAPVFAICVGLRIHDAPLPILLEFPLRKSLLEEVILIFNFDAICASPESRVICIFLQLHFHLKSTCWGNCTIFQGLSC